MKRSYECACGQPLFFRNSQCIRCQRALGYSTETNAVEALEPAEIADTYRFAGDESGAAKLWWRCANLDTPAACNWLLPALADEDPARPRLCLACGLNRTVPDWSVEENAKNWRSIERAKRRVISAVLGLGLPVRSRFSDDPQRGLAFDFLAPQPGGPAVMTGHHDGLITLNLEEADDVNREAVRARMHEPYRTVLGHLRHEIGHYYWDALIAGGPWLDEFRQLFGDETVDYASALQKHYELGADPAWPERCISSYASCHPWEDWAETWAHYLHMVDVLDTARSFGLVAHHDEIQYEPFTAQVLHPDDAPSAPSADDLGFLAIVNGWIELTGALNEVTRSMGEPDFYPFVLSRPAVRKLHFIHSLVRSEAGGRALGGSPTGAGGVADGDGSSTGAGGGAIGGGADGVGGATGGSPVSGGTGTVPPSGPMQEMAARVIA